MNATPTGNPDLQRAAELAAQAAREAGRRPEIHWPQPVTGCSPLDDALNGLLATMKDALRSAEAADICAADQQQAVLADLARREREGRL